MSEYQKCDKKLSIFKTLKNKYRGMSLDTKIMIGIIILFLVVFTVVVIDDCSTKQNAITVKTSNRNIESTIKE